MSCVARNKQYLRENYKMNITDLSFDIQEILEREVLHNQILNRIHKKQLILHKELVECINDSGADCMNGIFDEIGQYEDIEDKQDIFQQFIYEIDIHSSYYVVEYQ